MEFICQIRYVSSNLIFFRNGGVTEDLSPTYMHLRISERRPVSNVYAHVHIEPEEDRFPTYMHLCMSGRRPSFDVYALVHIEREEDQFSKIQLDHFLLNLL